MQKSTWVLLLLYFIISLPANFLVLAQSGSTTASILGKVKDPQEALITGALVTIKQRVTNLTRSVETDNDGSFQFIQLPPGEYEIVISATGFNISKDSFYIALGTTLLSEINLSLSSTDNVIEVDANNSFSEVKVESSNINNQIRIQNLPINRRDFLNFSLTSPRVTPDRILPSGTTATSGLSFNSQSARLNNITIDGSTNNETFAGGVRATFSQDAVQEFQIVSDSYAAEFGRAVGGIVNIVTRSGSNDYHGTIFNFIRNDSLGAREPFAPFKPDFRQYQFGATLGGPIKKDEIFFFTSFERLSVKQNNIVTIPDDLIDSARFNGYSAVQNGPLPFALGNTSVFARLDWQLSTQDRISLRYNGGFGYNGAFETVGDFAGGLFSPTASAIQRFNDNSGNINNIFVYGKLVNETRFLFSKRDQDVDPIDSDNAAVLLNSTRGTTVFGSNFLSPQQRKLRIYQIVNNVSVTKGRNTFKFGVDFNYNQTPDNGADFPIAKAGFNMFTPLDFTGMNGPFFTAEQTFDSRRRTPAQRAFLMTLAQIFPQVFPGFPANVPLADLALPTVFGQTFGNTTQEINQKLFSGFLQDDIQIKPNLFIKLGLRYDIFRETFTPKNNGNFNPRVAFAYTPHLLKDRLTIHGAYGVFFAGAPPVQIPLLAKTYDNRLDNPPALFQYLIFPFTAIPFSQQNHNFPASNTPPLSLLTAPQLRQTYQLQKDLKNSYSHQVTFGFNYRIDSNTVVSVDYNYLRGLKLLSSRFINPVLKPTGNPIADAFARRDPNRGFVFEFESAFDSYYNGLTVSINRRLARRVSGLIAYTFAKGIDNYKDFRTDIASSNDGERPGQERGLSVQDVRHRLVASGTWDLNYFKSKLINGFLLSFIVDVTSGVPYNLQAGVDLDGSLETLPADRPPASGTLRGYSFDCGCIIGRNTGIQPGFASVDLRVARIFKFKERYSIQATVETFNLFNKTNINKVNNIFSPDAQGNFNLPPISGGRYQTTPNQFLTAFRPRQIQFGLRFNF